MRDSQSSKGSHTTRAVDGLVELELTNIKPGLSAAQGKNKALADAGAIVPDSFEAFEGAIAKAFKSLADGGKLTPQPNVIAPTIPLDLEAAKKAGKVKIAFPSCIAQRTCAHNCKLLLVLRRVDTLARY